MKAVYNISYGVYILTAFDEKHNGCVINTLMQVTSQTPARISITVNKENYTTKQILKTGKFNVSILDSSTEFKLIERFGFSTGKETNKFENFNDFKISQNGVSYITKHTNAFISAKIISQVENDTHITFFAEITEENILSDKKSISYAYYLENLKPKPQQKQKSKVVYVCRICGYVYDGETIPDDFVCPICKHGVEDFERVENKEESQDKGLKKYICPVCGYEEESETPPEKCIICGAKMIEKK